MTNLIKKLGFCLGNTGLSTTNSGSLTTLAISDNPKAGAFSHQIEITQLANAHTLVFGGFRVRHPSSAPAPSLSILAHGGGSFPLIALGYPSK